MVPRETPEFWTGWGIRRFGPADPSALAHRDCFACVGADPLGNATAQAIHPGRTLVPDQPTIQSTALEYKAAGRASQPVRQGARNWATYRG